MFKTVKKINVDHMSFLWSRWN